MTRDPAHLKFVVFLCLSALILVFFHRVLLQDHQFAYRDAAHYYYPLYQRVQAEWNEGRIPLWEPEENAGMPLLGNPTAAVLYPGKVVYAVLPYAWAARTYIVLHVALAFVATLALMRSLGVSWTGAGLSALSYTFCGPILFQYCNVIFLVGAAWLPLGFLAVDRWVRRGSRFAMLGLGLVLMMQMLGGDPQASYLLGLCSLAYAAAVAWTSGRGFRKTKNEAVAESTIPWKRLALFCLIGATVWTLVTLESARVLPGLRPPKLPEKPTPPLPWMLWAPTVLPILWALVVSTYFGRRQPSQQRRTLWRLVTGLGMAGALAGALTAAQLLPVVEFTQQTVRAAAGGPHDIYPFSVEPFRVVELFLPNIFGSYFTGNASWLDLIRLSLDRSKVWAPSLYLGGAIVALALAASAFRKGEPSRVWFSWIAVVTLLGSFGEFTSPIWGARFIEHHVGVGYPGIGPLDPVNDPPLRRDGYLRDGDGGFYWAMTTFLPGFRQFRFPSKLMTFSILGVAVLAGFGWDDLTRGNSRRIKRTAVAFLAITVLAGLGVLIGRGGILHVFKTAELGSSFGPFDPAAAYRETLWSLGQGVVVFGGLLGIAALSRRRPVLACITMLAMTSIDLGVANHRMIATVPQALFEREPEVLAHIRAAEQEKPSDGPYRIHRAPIWNPLGWNTEKSPNRVGEFMEWEHDTIQPKYGINLGVEYTHTIGVAELYDYEWYFGGWPYSTTPEFAKSLNIPHGQKVVYYPRRSFNMWNTRYFVLPYYTNDWLDENRGNAAFLVDTERIFPPPEVSQSPEAVESQRQWIMTKDYQIRRNLKQFPRAWVVRRTRVLPPIKGLAPEVRRAPMMEIMYDDKDPIWHDPNMYSYDPLQTAWVENEDAAVLTPFSRGNPVRPSEKIEVRYPRSDRVELTVSLDAPGIVVLADAYYPGWKLTIDEKPAPVYRVNRMMRGAAVESGTHTLVFRYQPDSFRIGFLISLVGVVGTVALAGYAYRRPRVLLPWTSG